MTPPTRGGKRAGAGRPSRSSAPATTRIHARLDPDEDEAFVRLRQAWGLDSDSATIRRLIWGPPVPPTGCTHYLKTWPEPYAATQAGAKSYEIRRNDRDYRVGDLLFLQEWNPTERLYTGREMFRLVTYKTSGGEWGLPADLCILGTAPTVVGK
jgi:hypothetical protein